MSPPGHDCLASAGDGQLRVSLFWNEEICLMPAKTLEDRAEISPEASSGGGVEKAPPAASPTPAALTVPAAPPTPAALTIDAKHAVCNYANFCRVTGAPEEVLLDLGLNDIPMTIPTEPVVISQRVVLNYFTAKRLLHALQLTIQRHEAAFGAIEIDVQKRVTPRGR
jgi:hypothetical protein